MVESAVTLPLIIFMMLAVAEVGRAIAQYNLLTKSVRDAARFLADSPTDASGVPLIDDARWRDAQELVVYGTTAPGGGASPLLEGLTLGNVGPKPVPTADGHIEVRVTYTYEASFAPLPTFGIGDGDGITLGPFTASAVMQGLRI